MARDKDFWSQARPPDDPYAYVVVTVTHGPVDERCATIKNHGQKSLVRLLKTLARDQDVTILCVCGEDVKHCHRFTLAKLIALPRI